MYLKGARGKAFEKVGRVGGRGGVKVSHFSMQMAGAAHTHQLGGAAAAAAAAAAAGGAAAGGAAAGSAAVGGAAAAGAAAGGAAAAGAAATGAAATGAAATGAAAGSLAAAPAAQAPTRCDNTAGGRSDNGGGIAAAALQMPL